MKSVWKKALVAAFATGVGLVAGTARAAAVMAFPEIASGQSETVDGWLISAGQGVSLIPSISASGTLTLTKTADFTIPNDGALVTFLQTSATASADIVFSSESITNATGSAWNAFQFLLLNTSETNHAAFTGTGFVPPIGTGVDYTGVSMDSAKDMLTYTGSQANGSISNWGGTTDTDELVIATDPLGTAPFQDFALKELPTNGGGGSTAVSLPAAVWQSLTGLLGLGLIAGVGKLRKGLSA